MKKSIFVAGASLALFGASQAQAQFCSMLGEIKPFAGNFAPRGTTFANGQLLPISQNSALFSILGTIYGGDGRTTFAVPNLQGRIPLQHGNGPGLTRYPLGIASGSETNSLSQAQMAGHAHGATTTMTLKGTDANGTNADPTGRVLGDDGSDRVYRSATANVDMSSEAIAAETTLAPPAGATGTAVNNMMPFLTVHYVICIEGAFPSRS